MSNPKSKLSHYSESLVLKTAASVGLKPQLLHTLYRYRIARTGVPVRDHSEAPAIRALVSNLRDGDTFWDVGAMTGSYCSYARAACHPAEIHAFEPNPLYYSECAERIQSLPSGCKLEAHQLALSDESGEVHFATKMPDDANTSAGAIVDESTRSDFDSNSLVKVPITPGDELIHGGEIAKPEVLKIDVEGAEMKVLRGLSETLTDSIRAVLCEVHLPTEGPSPSMDDFGSSPEELHTFLEERGFIVQKVGGESVTTTFWPHEGN
jgi:FkbM family methyltransferase